MASNFSGLRKLGPDSDIVDVARIQGIGDECQHSLPIFLVVAQ